MKWIKGTFLDPEYRTSHPSWPWYLTAFLVLLFVGMAAIEYGSTAVLGSPTARALKKQLEPLADRLDDAAMVGDRKAATGLIDPVTKIISDYNTLDDAARAKVDASSLRYCVLASLHLATGINEVMEFGRWLNRDQYQNALDLCR